MSERRSKTAVVTAFLVSLALPAAADDTAGPEVEGAVEPAPTAGLATSEGAFEADRPVAGEPDEALEAADGLKLPDDPADTADEEFGTRRR